MYKLKFTNAYKRDYKRIKKQAKDLFLLDEVVDMLRQGKLLDKKYNDHVLLGNYNGYHECHIQPDWLLIYLVEDDVVTLTLTRTGTHADLFNK